MRHGDDNPCSECRWFGGENRTCNLPTNTSYNDQMWTLMMGTATTAISYLSPSPATKPRRSRTKAALLPCFLSYRCPTLGSGPTGLVQVEMNSSQSLTCFPLVFASAQGLSWSPRGCPTLARKEANALPSLEDMNRLARTRASPTSHRPHHWYGPHICCHHVHHRRLSSFHHRRSSRFHQTLSWAGWCTHSATLKLVA